MPWLPGADELLILPVEDVAMHLLKRIARRPHHARRASNFTGVNGEVLSQGTEYHRPEVVKAIGEAWDWLYVNGLLTVSPNDPNEGFFVISRKGLRMAEE